MSSLTAFKIAMNIIKKQMGITMIIIKKVKFQRKISMHNLVFILVVNEGSILSSSFFCNIDICFCTSETSLYSQRLNSKCTKLQCSKMLIYKCNEVCYLSWVQD